MKNIGPIEYYIGCNYCNKAVKDIEGLKLDCLYCGQTDGITVRRYQLNVEISDGSTILQATLFNHDVHRLMLLFGIEMPTTVKESEIFQQKLDSTDFVVGLRKNALNEDQSFSLTYSVACICKAITRDNCVQQQTPHACSSNIVEETFLVGNLTKRMLDLDGSLKHAIDIIEDDTSEQKSASQDKDHVPSPSHSDLISSLNFEDTSFWNELNLDSLLEIENELYKLLQPSIEAEPAVQYDPLVKVVEGESSHANEPVCDFHQEIHHDLEFMNVMIGKHHDVATEAPSNVKEVSKSGETIIVDKRTSKPWNFDTISPLFHLPASQAAKELNVSEYKLTKMCKKLGVKRWPYRKLHSLDNLLENLQYLSKLKTYIVGKERVIELQEEKERILKDPNIELCAETQVLMESSRKKRRYRHLMDTSHSSHYANSSKVHVIKSEEIDY
nr:protein RKD1-like [Ipomoea batatas]